jgi:polyhydroxyalkanoate synthase
MELTQKIMADPGQTGPRQARWIVAELSGVVAESRARNVQGQPLEAVVREQKGDKRFKHDDWQDNVLFSYIKQSYC